MADDKVLSVRMYGEHIGFLEQTPVGKMQFTYEAKAPYKLSIGMEIREEPYDEIKTEAYFGGLLPESELARKKIGLRYGVNHNNSFALLKAIGYDCAGAVSLHASEEPVSSKAANLFQLKGKVFSENELYQHIQELPKKPLFLESRGCVFRWLGLRIKRRFV